MMNITKAIIPAAGIGSRFLPATKTIPKEMLPVVDKPAIQYIIEEGVRSGISNFIIINSKHKKSLEDHFDSCVELETFLKTKKKEQALGLLPKILSRAEFTYIRQRHPQGLGHAVWMARHCIGKEYVAVMLPDDIMIAQPPGIAQLMKIARQEKCSVVAVQEVPMNQVSRYGVIAIKKQFSPNLFQVKTLVEKPSEISAPSNLAIIGRYVLSPHIFRALDETAAGALDEIQLTDAIVELISMGEKIFAYKIKGTRYDTGTPFGWLQANIALALSHPSYSDSMLQYLQHLDKELIVMQNKAAMLRKKESF